MNFDPWGMVHVWMSHVSRMNSYELCHTCKWVISHTWVRHVRHMNGWWDMWRESWVDEELQHTATHCNTLQHTTTHCNTLQHTAAYGDTLHHTAAHCSTQQHTATHCNSLQRHNASHDFTSVYNSLLFSSFKCVYIYIYSYIHTYT